MKLERDYYRPHLKDGEGNVFTGLCLSVGGGGGGVTQSLVPGPFWGRGTPFRPVAGGGKGYLTQACS